MYKKLVRERTAYNFISLRVTNLTSLAVLMHPARIGKTASWRRQVLANTNSQIMVDAESTNTEETNWFSSRTITHADLATVSALQLVTYSHDQGTASSPELGSWSWFDVCVADALLNVRERDDGSELRWRSHENPIASDQFEELHGKIFGPEHEIWSLIEVGDVILVKACAQHPHWQNHAICGSLSLLTLAVSERMTHIMTEESVTVYANGSNIAEKDWLTSRPLTHSDLATLTAIQLVTRSHDQGWVSFPDLGSYSWFDICIADAEHVVRERPDGSQLRWCSHTNPLKSHKADEREGVRFGRHDDIWSHLKVGDVILVKVCAQFPGWSNTAVSGCICFWHLAAAQHNTTLAATEQAIEVYANSATVVEEGWFASAPFARSDLARGSALQLVTYSQDQGWADFPDQGSWSWFDVCIADAAFHVRTREDGSRLQWTSHCNPITSEELGERRGKLFSPQHEIWSYLMEGDLILVKACARFPGWANYASRGDLFIWKFTDACTM